MHSPHPQALCLLLAGLACAPAADAAEKRARPPVGVSVETFQGWERAHVLRAPEVEVVVAVTPDSGGRIVHFSLRGENVLQSDPRAADIGGHELDLAPLPGVPPHAALVSGRHTASIVRDYTVRVTSPPDLATGVQLEKEITLDPDTGELGVTQRLRNLSVDHEFTYALRDRTRCAPGGFVFFPPSRQSRFPAGWSLRVPGEGREINGAAAPSHPSVLRFDTALVIHCAGVPAQLDADSDAGWIACARRRTLLVRYFPHYAKAAYPGGRTVSVEFGGDAAAIETFSPEVKLKPGETFEFPGLWRLVALDRDVTTAGQARALQQGIAPSPFKK